MKYMAILFSLLFALNAPTMADTATEEPMEAVVPELTDVAGVVTEIAEDHLLLDTATHGQVFAHLTEETVYEGETPEIGAYVHIVNNGAMTMSLPPQITALRVGCYAFSGTISELSDESFLLTTAEGAIYQVNAEAEKLADLADGLFQRHDDHVHPSADLRRDDRRCRISHPWARTPPSGLAGRRLFYNFSPALLLTAPPQLSII